MFTEKLSKSDKVKQYYMKRTGEFMLLNCGVGEDS